MGQIVNSFTSYNLSPKEILSGSVLNQEQQMVLQNEHALVAEQLLSLDFDPAKPNNFLQEQAFLRGQMSILRVMLLRSEESQKTLSNFQE